jgi:hypothetical protein
MSKTATLRTTPTQEELKTPATRLLDMLGGWAQYVSQDEANGIKDPMLSSEEIGALYQQAGELNLSDPDEETVYRFVMERLLPLLLRKAEK